MDVCTRCKQLRCGIRDESARWNVGNHSWSVRKRKIENSVSWREGVRLNEKYKQMMKWPTCMCRLCNKYSSNIYSQARQKRWVGGDHFRNHNCCSKWAFRLTTNKNQKRFSFIGICAALKHHSFSSSGHWTNIKSIQITGQSLFAFRIYRLWCRSYSWRYKRKPSQCSMGCGPLHMQIKLHLIIIFVS